MSAVHTVSLKNAQQMIARMREIEKIAVRGASLGRLEYLRLNDFASDGPVSNETIQEVQQILHAASVEHDNGPWWTTQTWKI